MKASALYRITAVVLVLFAAGHGFGFWQVDPSWGAGAVVAPMRSVHFTLQGFNRSYWDFFLANGFTVDVFLVFTAILAWQLGGLPGESLARLRLTAWMFAACFAVIALLCFTYLFLIPIVFSVVAAALLAAAAWRSRARIPTK